MRGIASISTNGNQCRRAKREDCEWKMRPLRAITGGYADPKGLSETDLGVKRTKAAYGAKLLKNCHAAKATQQAHKDGGCPTAHPEAYTF